MKLKKSLSFILAMLTFCTILSVVPASAAVDYASAADGAVLYDVLFNQTTGVYTPTLLNSGEDQTVPITTAVPSEDGKSIVFTKPTDNKGKRWYFGGKIDGLTIGEGKQYTLEASLKVEVQNIGMFFNFGDNPEEVGAYYNGLYGYYGSPQNWNDKVNETLAYGGSKARGQYRCDGIAYYTADDVKVTPDAEGYVTLSIEVDGYSYNVFKNGVFFDKGFISPDIFNKNIGLSFYLYNAGTLTVKDAKVIKGLKYSSVSGFTYPETKRFETPTFGDAQNMTMAAYNSAAVGDKLADINFNNMADFKPTTYYTGGSEVIVTPSDDGKSISFEKGTTKAGTTWWGAAIGDLKITKDTTYTFKYKIKSNSKNAGIHFNFNEATPENRYNFGTYGCFTNEDPLKSSSIVIEQGATKITGTVQQITSYVVITPKLDDNGFVDLAIEVNGYTWSVYYIGLNGEYIKHDEYVANDTDIAYGGAQIGLSAYLYNTGATMSLSDVELYKGLVVSSTMDPVDETTVPVETTVVPDTTKAPDTTTKAPDTTKTPETTKAPDTTKAPEKKGCGKSGTITQFVALICGAAAVIIIKKKH